MSTHEGFTPGPWRTFKYCDGSREVGTNHRKVVVTAWKTQEEDEANLSLIAAAPELLAENTRLREVNRELLAAAKLVMADHNTIHEEISYCSIHALEAAIAKAEEVSK